MSDHFKKYWPHELRLIQEAVRANKGVVLTDHFDSRMTERGIGMGDIVCAIMTGEIVEGYSAGQYPCYRNPDELRTIVGNDMNGELITLGIALKRDSFCFTTLYKGVTKRLEYVVEQG